MDFMVIPWKVSRLPPEHHRLPFVLFVFFVVNFYAFPPGRQNLIVSLWFP